MTVPATPKTFGVGLRPQHYQLVADERPTDVDHFEIISENFLGVGGRPRWFLDRIREHYPLFMHGVGLSIGSPDPLAADYLAALASLVKELKPRFVSDHLCWTTIGGRNSHDLLPVAYTRASLELIANRVDAVQERLGRRLLLENPSAYVAFRAWDYDEAGFFAELCRRTGAGILLDVNNLYVNHRNLGADPLTYLDRLSPSDVGYLHVAGHQDHGDLLIDTHDAPVCAAVWELYRWATARFPAAPVVVEWDDQIPEFTQLAAECARARAYFAQPGELPITVAPAAAPSQPMPALGTAYRQLLTEIVQPFGITPTADAHLALDLPVPAVRGLRVYHHAYFLRLEEVLADTFPLLHAATEEDGFRHLIAAYLAAYPPSRPSVSAAGERLAEFLRSGAPGLDFDFGVDCRVLADLAAIEAAQAAVHVAPDTVAPVTPAMLQSVTEESWPQLRCRFVDALRLIKCAYELEPIERALLAGEPPPWPEACPNYRLIARVGHEVQSERLDPTSGAVLAGLLAGSPLAAACEIAANSPDTGVLPEDEVVERAGALLVRLTQLRLIAAFAV